MMLLSRLGAFAQHDYVAPNDPAVQQKLANWQNLKFGLLMHWGTYSQWGIVESWSICPEDEGWTQRKGPYSASYNTYVKAYENLQTTFNPVKFDPDKWAAAAKDAGMKYIVFTTKHHDGFCMFDTKQTDYKITDVKTPFSKNPKANITKEVFNAFSKDGFMIGAYFSKPDWHSPDYWWPYFPPKDRNVNYDPAKYPERWQKFKDYTYNQIGELLGGDYGKVDILWLDGGWVRPKTSADAPTRFNQDIDMAKIAEMGREKQPGLIVVDRSVGGKYENYTTPEQQIPDKPLTYPWESCITMGDSWSYVPGDHYKPTHDLIQLLVKIVSRGGNFLLNIGPGPEGDWDPIAYERLHQIGNWMKINGEGIYNSEPIAPYSQDNVYFTKAKNKPVVYAFILSGNDGVTLPESLSLNINAGTVKKVSLLGTSPTLKWKADGNKLVVLIPEKLRTGSGLKYAATLKIEQ
jgi:alpha-L-fucosidase